MLAANHRAGARRAGAFKYLRGERFAAVHRADAKGVPVATFAIGEAGAANAGLFAVAMLASLTNRSRSSCFRSVTGRRQARRDAELPPVADRQMKTPRCCPRLLARLPWWRPTGRMFVHAAQAMGYKVLVPDPDASGPAARPADDIVVAAYDDATRLAAFGKRVGAVTTDSRTFPAALEALAAVGADASAAGGARIASPPRKAFSADTACRLGRCGDPRRAEDLRAAPPTLFPGILKAATLGYDGKGPATVTSFEQALLAWMSMKQAPCWKR